MAINEINVVTTNEAENKSQPTRRTEIIPLTLDTDDEVIKSLAFEYRFKKPINTIFGKVISLKPVINLLEFKNFNPIFLSKDMSLKDFQEWKKIRRRRPVVNKTEIFKLVAADRLFSDRALLEELRKRYKDKLDEILFVPYIRIRRGILETEVPNKNLKPYGLILTRLVRIIIEEFKDEVITEIPKEEYHDRKLKLKERIWEDMENYIKERPILKSLTNDVSDETLKELFMK